MGQVGLMIGLLLGAVGVGGFVGLQMAQEARTAVVAVTEALPAWSFKPQNSNGSLALQVRLCALSAMLCMLLQQKRPFQLRDHTLLQETSSLFTKGQIMVLFRPQSQILTFSLADIL